MKPRLLDRYVGWRFAAIYAANLVSFTLIYVLVDTTNQYQALSEKSSGFGDFLRTWIQFYWAQLPILYCRVLGAVVLAASAAFVVTLVHRSNEFTPMLSAGISLRRALAPVLLLSGVASLASVAVQEVWIPANSLQIRAARAPGRGRSDLYNVKYFDPRRRVLVIFRRYQLKNLEGERVLVFPLGGQKGHSYLIEARSARWIQEKGSRGQWILSDGFYQEYDEAGSLVPVKPSPPGPASSQPAGRSGDPANGLLLRNFTTLPLSSLVETDMLPQDLEERESQEPFLWLKDLWAKAKRSSDAARWRIRLLARLADPLHGLVLVLLGIPTILARGSRNIFLSALATVVMSALYFVAYTACLNLGNRGVLSPGLAAGLAPVFFGALGVSLYARMRS